jgi:hypothetical protein
MRVYNHKHDDDCKCELGKEIKGGITRALGNKFFNCRVHELVMPLVTTKFDAINMGFYTLIHKVCTWQYNSNQN